MDSSIVIEPYQKKDRYLTLETTSYQLTAFIQNQLQLHNVIEMNVRVSNKDNIECKIKL